MSISSEITRINGNIAAAYTAAGNKGATMPATQNSANLATCIGTISGGGGGYSEIPSYQIVNGQVQMRTLALTGNEFSGITSIGYGALRSVFYEHTGITGALDFSSLISVGDNGLSSTFRGCTGITSVDLSALTYVIGTSGLNSAFYGCTGITSVDLSALTSIGGSNGLNSAFYGCTSLTSVDLSALATANQASSLNSVFRGCTSLTKVNFTSLSNIGSASCLATAFRDCTALTDVYFNALTTTSFGSYTNQFNNMMQNTGSNVTHTLHFPSNLQSKISGLSGYPLFGGTSGYVTLSFDLTATS